VTCNDDAWALELKTAQEAELPFLSVDETHIRAAYNGFAYGVFCKKGAFVQADGCVFRIRPHGGKIALDCSKRI
jgi:hypothetical protein